MNNYVDFNSNDLFSKMNSSDKLKFLELLKEYKIEFRKKLNIDNDSTFGIEIEYDGEYDKVDSLVKTKNYEWLKSGRLKDCYWKHEIDRSIIVGGEVISPILRDTEETWMQIKDICEMLKNNGCSILNEPAAHIHYGTQILGNNVDNWLLFFKLYSAYENVTFRYGYNEFQCSRPRIYAHANPIAHNLLYTCNKFDNYIEKPSFRKLIKTILFTYKKDAIELYGVLDGGTSFKENRTIEFRSPNGTLEPIIWQNNVNTFYHILKYATNDKYNDDIISQRIKKNRSIINNINYYNEINVDQVFEFVDLIFGNNLDKINFLRQYFKDFVEKNSYEKAKEFIKR